MRNILLLFIIILFFCNCKSKNNLIEIKKEYILDDNKQNFELQIKQNNSLIKILNNEILLDRRPFEILFNLYYTNNIQINVSYNSKLFDLSLKEDVSDISEITNFAANQFADSLFNINPYIFISDDGWNFYYYNNKEDHKFKNVTVNEYIINCSRYIEYFFDLEKISGKSNISLNEINKPLYFVFALSKDLSSVSKIYGLKIIFK